MVSGRLLLVSICIASTLLSGCAKSVFTSPQASEEFTQDGSIVISRPLPHRYNASLPLTALGFVPTYQSAPGNWLLIDTAKKTISLMEGEKVSMTSPADFGLSSIKPGSYSLLHKQRNPLWYAPESYFVSRKLAVPPDGDRSRFRRGALGDFVLYLDKDTPIHSGALWSGDVGGVKLDDNALSKIFYVLQIGSPIQVQ